MINVLNALAFLIYAIAFFGFLFVVLYGIPPSGPSKTEQDDNLCETWRECPLDGNEEK
jgi:hypothetical protein